MGLPRSNDGEARFSAYVEGLTSVIGHADRGKPLRDYCLGLMMPCERKSVEPMAAITAPERTAAQHQSLLHFIGEGKWSDERVLAKVRELVLPEMERHGPIEAWIIDDTGFPKKGQHSVRSSAPILRRAWQAGQLSGRGDVVDRQSRCKPAGGVSAVSAERLGERSQTSAQGRNSRRSQFQDQARDRAGPNSLGVRGRAAAWSGVDGRRLRGRHRSAQDHHDIGLKLRRRNPITHEVWAPGSGPRPPKWSGRGRPPKLLRRDNKHKPVSVKQLALALPEHAWRKITWREATAEKLSSRFARVRVRVAHRDYWLSETSAGGVAADRMAR